MYRNYGNLKVHFDKLLTQPPNQYHTIDHIRGLYHQAFNRKISLFDIYRTHLNIETNPVNNIITLVGNDSHKPIVTGVMADYNGIVFVNAFSEDILKPMDVDMATKYIRRIYKDMDIIVSQDPLYNDLKFAKKNPYSMYLRMLPLYIAFHHVGTTMPNALDWGIFEQIIIDKRMATDKSDVDMIIRSMLTGKYADEPWLIYSSVSCSNSITLFKDIKKDTELV